MSANGKAALRLAKTGQPVFPCRTTGERAKTPYTRTGFKEATTDREQIKAWWKKWPDAAIGIPTGVLWDVLDVDTKGVDGRQHLPFLNRVGLLNGCKSVVKTPSGGWHLYFKADPDGKNHSNRDLGLDVRGNGGYVLAPPSFIASEESAGHYAQAGDTTGSTDEPIHWNLIVSALAPTDQSGEPIVLLRSEKRGSLAHLKAWLLERRSGERNNSLHWAVCRCIEDGIDPNELQEVAEEIGLGSEEIKATIGSALRRAGVAASDLMTEADSMFG